MRNITNKTETVSVKVCDSITCNNCGKKFKEEGFDPAWANTIHSFSIDFGYHSKHDGDNLQFDLCEQCLEQFIKKFKIPVQIKERVTCWG
ncbi:MAG: hypothetical protein ACYDG2_21165 [Ruminiclostridium sp.]